DPARCSCAESWGQPALNKAVQGQTAAQPEGAFLNLVNWVGNVIAPVGAALCVVMAIVAYTHGRGVTRWAVAAGGLLAISGLTRLIEKGSAVVCSLILIERNQPRWALSGTTF